MSKKTTSLITLIVFSVFIFSCYPVKRIERIDKMKSRKFSGIKVLAVVNENGKWIRFSKPGKILKDVIEGVIIDKQGNTNRFTIPRSKVRWMWTQRFNAGKSLFRLAGFVSLALVAAMWISPPDF